MFRHTLMVIACTVLTGCGYGHRRPAEKPIYKINSEVVKVDPNLQSEKEKFTWYDARAIGIEGKGWAQTEHFYDRLPAKAKGVVRDVVWQLSENSAGMYVRFETDSNLIAAKWKLGSKELAWWHIPQTGVSGVDLYIRDIDAWYEVGVSKPLQFPKNEQVLVRNLWTGGKLHEFVLYLPLYNTTESLEIGIAPDCKLVAGPAWAEGIKPIVIYGTSITQGACASRPGMAYSNILQRRLNRPTINLGFSGNAKLEPEMASLLAELDPSVYVLDPVPNVGADEVKERFAPFIATLRRAHPDTPIVICESYSYPQTPYLMTHDILTDNAALRTVYDELKAKGDRNVYYVTREVLIGTDGEAFVDTLHPTDVGMMRVANGLEPILRKLVNR
jgi:hypothetical protein